MRRTLINLAIFSQLLPTAVDGAAIPQPPQHPLSRQAAQKPLSPPPRNLTLPVYDPAPSRRTDEVEQNRKGYLYGESLIGNSSYFLSGVLGNQLVREHLDWWYADAAWVTEIATKESEEVRELLVKRGGLNDLASYELIYDGRWKEVNPTGVAPGLMTNYTQDLLFSMERLSTNPFTVRRLHPTGDKIRLDVEDRVVREITGSSLADLHAAGRLFLSDHSYLAGYLDTLFGGRYSAACSAYFYIHPDTDEFLPLAIRTNVGANLTYTPLDEPNDWLLAKMMYNANDLFHGQIFHLAQSHAVAEIVHQAALRTLSKLHPVRAYLDRIMHQAYAIRPVGEQVLFNDGGYFDRAFPYHNTGARRFATEFYPTVGRFRANYLLDELQSRCLVNCTYGPPLSHFPFFEDAAPIVDAIREFSTRFVRAYYPNEDLLVEDDELQAWVTEATGPAHVLDFPEWPLWQKDTLVDVLTHLAYLTGVSHHAINSGMPCSVSAILPFHPGAIFQPIPESKGVKSVLPYLPDLDTSMAQVQLFIQFNRAQVAEEEGNLVHMFSDNGFLYGHDSEVERSAENFKRRMEEISDTIRGRGFDKDGMAQGMPFVWRGLDPRNVPFYLSV